MDRSDPTDDPRGELARQMYDLGRAAVEKGDLAAAGELFRASVAAHPHFKTLKLLGEVLSRLGSSREGAVYLAAAAGLAPRQATPRVLLAEIMLAWGDIDDARAQLELALEITPHYRRARELLERIHHGVNTIDPKV